MAEQIEIDTKLVCLKGQGTGVTSVKCTHTLNLTWSKSLRKKDGKRDGGK